MDIFPALIMKKGTQLLSVGRLSSQHSMRYHGVCDKHRGKKIVKRKEKRTTVWGEKKSKLKQQFNPHVL